MLSSRHEYHQANYGTAGVAITCYAQLANVDTQNQMMQSRQERQDMRLDTRDHNLPGHVHLTRLRDADTAHRAIMLMIVVTVT